MIRREDNILVCLEPPLKVAAPPNLLNDKLGFSLQVSMNRHFEAYIFGIFGDSKC